MTTRDVFRLREFRLLFAGHGVSVFGNRMVAVALAFAVLELGGSASEVGLVLAASFVPAVATVLACRVTPERRPRWHRIAPWTSARGWQRSPSP